METKDELVEALIPIVQAKGKKYLLVAMELAQAKFTVAKLEAEGGEGVDAMCALFAFAITSAVDECCKTTEEQQELFKLSETILEVFFKEQEQAAKLTEETIQGAKA